MKEEDVIDQKIADQMTEMAGFRNVLAHEYSDIKDERVFNHLQDLGKFEAFAKEIFEFSDQSEE